ncbi:MAG: ABC transporter substrate-binding protein [Defluviitaleaceae bacterium]|nr:ABC transporter substrate-binding protein [Defluviitaleaceae bacterium]MCL2836722.1 ABC transporter substrate-binding protein [Defluviitaleaceae bacterium]
MKKIFALVLTAAMLFGAAACQTESEGTQGVTDTSITVANSAAASGAFAPVGVPFNAGIEAYFRMVNEGEGGIDGRNLVFLHYTDDEFDPIKGKAALEGMVEDAKVFAIVGHFGTPTVAATVEDLKEYGIPAVYFATGIGQLYATNAATNAEGFNLFPVQPIYQTEGRIMVAYAAGMFGASRIGVIYTNDDAGMDLFAGVREQVELLDGIELVAEQVTAGSPDVSAAVTSIKNANVDFIIVASIQATMPTIVKELAAQSVNVDCVTTYVNVALAQSAAVAEDIQGKFDVYGLGWVSMDLPEDMAVFADWIQADYAANSFAMAGWIAGHFFTEGVRRLEGKEVTWESYMEALEEAPIRAPFGGFVDFTNGQRLGVQEMNLSKIVPLADEFPLGWQQVGGFQGITSLIGE